MAFVLSQTSTYTWPVKLTLPVSGGRREVHTFDAEFKRLPQRRINELIQQIRAQERGRRDDEDLYQDTDAAREILVGWGSVHDDAGKDIPFTDKACEELLDIPTVAGQIVKAWFNSLEAGKKGN